MSVEHPRLGAGPASRRPVHAAVGRRIAAGLFTHAPRVRDAAVQRGGGPRGPTPARSRRRTASTASTTRSCRPSSPGSEGLTCARSSSRWSCCSPAGWGSGSRGCRRPADAAGRGPVRILVVPPAGRPSVPRSCSPAVRRRKHPGAAWPRWALSSCARAFSARGVYTIVMDAPSDHRGGLTPSASPRTMPPTSRGRSRCGGAPAACRFG